MISISPTILHVEDDANDRAFLQRAIRKSQLPVHLESAEDGEVAVEYLSGEEGYQDRNRFPMPSLVLLDLKMPRKTGFEVLEWVRNQSQFCFLPVVVFSSSNNEEDMKKAYKLGANSYLLKPVSFEELEKNVQQLYSYWFILNHAPQSC